MYFYNVRKIRNRFLLLTGILIILVCISCSPQEKIGISEDPRLQHSFSGNYKDCERITIGFGADGRFACMFNSTEFAGRFWDVVWGTYSVDSTHVYLHVDRCNEDNLRYDSLPFEIADSILFTASGDSLRVFFKDGLQKEETILSPEKSISSFTTAGNKDDSVVVKVIFGLVMMLVYLGPIVLVGLLIRLIARLIKKSRNPKD